jgi:hypothetical protein
MLECYTSNSIVATPKRKKTKVDSPLEVTQQLYKTHHQLNYIKIDLELYAEILDDQDSTHRKLAEVTLCSSTFHS